MSTPIRSREADSVIRRYRKRGAQPPKNGSAEALHSDHVFPLTNNRIEQLKTKDDWIDAMTELTTVVCLVASENYMLEQAERTGSWGWEKYEDANIELVEVASGRTFTSAAIS